MAFKKSGNPPPFLQIKYNLFFNIIEQVLRQSEIEYQHPANFQN